MKATADPRRSMAVLVAVAALSGAGRADAPGDAAGDRPFLHPLFTDHAVLQRGAAIAVWGWTEPGKAVTVELAGETATGTADARGKC